MANLRKSALYTAAPRTDWGGSYADSKTYASLFHRNRGAYDFGIMDVQTFATQVGSNMVNKPLLYMTQGQGNVFSLPAGTDSYKWKLATDGINRAVITDVDTSLPTQPGKTGTSFRIALDRGYYHEPVLLKTESRDLPMMRIQGFPFQEAPNKFWYTVTLQGSDPTAYMDTAYLQPGRTIVDGGTSVSSELNEKYAGIEFGSTTELQSHIGYQARKFEMTDRLIRQEIGARKVKADPMTKYTISDKFGQGSFTSAVSTGYVVAPFYDDAAKNKTRIVEEGSLITTAETMVRERLMLDCEWAMTFGKNEITNDPDTGFEIKMGAGYFEIVRDGNYFEHSGSLTLADFTEKLTNAYFNAVDLQDRTTYVRTGQVGLALASRLIESEFGSFPFVLSDSYFIDKVSHNKLPNELRFGAQFTEFIGYNGQRIVFLYDPTKDNPLWYPELDPDTGKPMESASFDISDLGATDAAPMGARTRSNIAYINEPDADEYFWVSNVYDPITGSEKAGGNVANLSKEAGVYMAKSCKFEVWDVSRIMRIAYV